MLHPNDDLFACGYAEPRSRATVCDIAFVDDLIILGIVVAATIASSQAQAAAEKSNGNELLDAQQKQQMKQTELGWLSQRGHDAMAGVAARNHGHGGGSMTDSMQPLIQKDAIDNHYELGRQAINRQADLTREMGYIHAGTAVASGIAGAALSPASSAGSFTSGAGYEGTGADIGARAAGYDLNQGASTLLSSAAPVATQALRSSDPQGGFQLQPSDYQTLAGAQPYSQSPFGDDPYATAPQFQNPNRYRFGL